MRNLFTLNYRGKQSREDTYTKSVIWTGILVRYPWEYSVKFSDFFLKLIGYLKVLPTFRGTPVNWGIWDTSVRWIVNNIISILSAGRRACIGEQLAKQEFFLLFANLMHAFKITNPEGQKLPEPKGVFGLTHRPPKFNINVISRQ